MKVKSKRPDTWNGQHVTIIKQAAPVWTISHTHQEYMRFAEWISKNGYERTKSGYWISFLQEHDKKTTTEKLFERFQDEQQSV